MLTTVIMSVVMVVPLLFTYSDVALSASIRNEGTPSYATVRPSAYAEKDQPWDVWAEWRWSSSIRREVLAPELCISAIVPLQSSFFPRTFTSAKMMCRWRFRTTSLAPSAFR